jgi:hypothetical protein
MKKVKEKTRKIIEKTLWLIYSKEPFFSSFLTIIGLFLIYILAQMLNIKPFYDFREILKAILDKEDLKKLPDIVVFVTTLLISFIISISTGSFIKDKILPLKKSQIISTLNDRCWEIYKLGQKWLEDSIQNVLDKVDGFRTGIRVNYEEVCTIINALYEITDTKRIHATWLSDISTLGNEEKSYLEVTHNKIKDLRKFTLTRYFVGNDIDIFINSPSQDIIWFVRQHSENSFNLKFIQNVSFKTICQNNGIDISKSDVLFFDKKLALLLILDKNTLQPNMINNNYILEVTDTRTDKDKYSKFFTDLENNSIDIINYIKEHNKMSLYGF